ncbi:alpha/beta fold hydrolase [Embleya sp. NBC_00896]|uniref:alpha/beta fold hydrolase n=1 Tax=Embleya sp. NBC_00896 TaxID=2975961 RepID=UPI00386DC8F5|nr:alpha/beta hydrolase [Embleya sp. NBC_00896]
MTTIARWGGTSRVADLDGATHWVDFGGPVDVGAGANGDAGAGAGVNGDAGAGAGRDAGAPTIVLVHGLGGSHLNWALLAPLLIGRARVVAIDLAGFGLTRVEGRRADVSANRVLLDRFLREVIGGPAVLIGNSMGGMISIRQAAIAPDTVTGLVLLDPVLPPVLGVLPDPRVIAAFLAYAIPGLGPAVLARNRARYTPREQVLRVLALVCANPAGIPEEMIAAATAPAEERARIPDLDRAFVQAATSVARPGRAALARYRGELAALRMPVLLLHGEQDRFVRVRQAREAAARRPAWRFETFPGVGHVPQLEIPDTVADRVTRWLDDTAAASSSR